MNIYKITEASECDYIIKGVAGEFYPCNPDIFDATYEKVEPTAHDAKGEK